MTEYEILARQAVLALQASNQPTWTDVAGAIVSALVGLGQCGLIAWGLWRMGQTGARRDKQIDQQGKALEEMGAGIRALLERSKPAS